MLILARHLIVLFLATSTACSQLQPRPDLAAEFAIEISTDAPLDRATMASEANHPAHSAFGLLVEGSESFAARVQSARMAKRSIDVQTYIWHADLTGMFFAHELLQAADRGVRVRLMIDDLDARAKNVGAQPCLLIFEIRSASYMDASLPCVVDTSAASRSEL